MCTKVYPELADRLAMWIGGENRPRWIQRRHLDRLGNDVGIKPRVVQRIMDEMEAMRREGVPTSDKNSLKREA